MSVIERLRHFSSCIEIAHHIPGRIRLRLVLDDLPPLDAPVQSLIARARDFKEALDNAPGIRSIRVNALARSCTVEYDHATIPFQAWPDFLGGVDSEAASVLTRIIANKYAEVACA